MREYRIYVDAYGDCELVGDVDRDQLGDLYVREIHVEIRIEGRLTKLRPQTLDDRTHLESKLLEDYEEEKATLPRVEAV